MPRHEVDAHSTFPMCLQELRIAASESACRDVIRIIAELEEDAYHTPSSEDYLVEVRDSGRNCEVGCRHKTDWAGWLMVWFLEYGGVNFEAERVVVRLRFQPLLSFRYLSAKLPDEDA